MGILDAFTGDAYAKAGTQQRTFLGDLMAQQQARIGQAQTQGLGSLQTAQTGALGSVGGGIGQARTDIQGGINPALQALYSGQGLGAEALTGAVDPAIAALREGAGTAMGAYDPLGAAAQQYGQFGNQASNAQADALGLNGPEGVARAQAQFQAGPGFQFALNQGLNSLGRQANMAGMVAGGNALQEAQRYGMGLGQQEWDKYVANLGQRQQLYSPLQASALGTAAGGISNAALTGGTGAANIYTGTGGRLSSLLSGTGQGAADIYGRSAQSLADLARTGGLASADIQTGTGAREAGLIQGLTGLETQFMGQMAQPYASTWGAQAAAETAGSRNLAQLGLAGLEMAGGAGFLPSGAFKPWGQS